MVDRAELEHAADVGWQAGDDELRAVDGQAAKHDAERADVRGSAELGGPHVQDHATLTPGQRFGDTLLQRRRRPGRRLILEDPHPPGFRLGGGHEVGVQPV